VSAQLQRLVVEYRGEELVVRTLYRRGADGPNPDTKARTREVTDLTREGLHQVLASLDSEAGAECVGTSGFTTREDVLLAITSLAALQTARQVKGGNPTKRG
jgi:hypothetical protein